MSEGDREIELIKRKKVREWLAMREGRVERAVDRPIDVTDATFDEFIKRAELVVVDCWAEWCPPCRMLEPVMEELARRFAGKVLFGKLNVDENLTTVTRFSIAEIPTLLLFKGGKLVKRVVGYRPLAELETIIKTYL
ncbi:MAG: thioredoxin [Candidatus Nezhaarchaeales archaeon]